MTVKKAGEETSSTNTTPKSSLNSAVTTDLPNDAPTSDTVEVKTSEATMRVPRSAIVDDAPAPERELTEAEKAQVEATSKSFEIRAIDAGIGLVKVDGIDFRYVGLAPARDSEPETPGGIRIGPENSTFTPLSNVPFHPSIRIKDPSSGEFYFPGDGMTSWENCTFEGNPLVPAEADAEATAAREEGLKTAVNA